VPLANENKIKEEAEEKKNISSLNKQIQNSFN
jgi:hypothetical protein